MAALDATRLINTGNITMIVIMLQQTERASYDNFLVYDKQVQANKISNTSLKVLSFTVKE